MAAVTALARGDGAAGAGAGRFVRGCRAKRLLRLTAPPGPHPHGVHLFLRGDRTPRSRPLTEAALRRLKEFGEIVNPKGIRILGEFPNLTAAMEQAGWPEPKIRKIMG